MRIIKIFCASPGDLGAEREQFRKCVDEFNRNLASAFEVRFEIKMWEYDTYSSIGLDAQSVISAQIGNEYSLFFGMMWARFGTPTLRMESGTVEELDAAIRRWKESKDSIDIMFLFKDTPVHISELDANQIYNVLRFREKIASEGIYYMMFGGKDNRDFSEICRQHLIQYAKSLHEKVVHRKKKDNASEFRYFGEIDRLKGC